MCNINARAVFLGKYGVSTSELLHFPMMFSESMKGFHVPGVPLVRLEFLYEVCGYFGISEGSVRTALSRMRKMGVVEQIKTADSTRYRVSPMQIEVMNNFTKRLKKKEKGFVIAIYSFEKHQEKKKDINLDAAAVRRLRPLRPEFIYQYAYRPSRVQEKTGGNGSIGKCISLQCR